MAEARVRFGLSVYKIYLWAWEGKITPVARDGHQTYYLESELEYVVRTGKSPYPSLRELVEALAG